MCLTINKQDINLDEEIKTATQDIVCWKVLNKSNGSVFQGFHYILGKKYILGFDLRVEQDDDGISNNNGSFIVNHGFHSWKEPSYYNSSYEKLVKCIIPKGSKYIEGIQHDDEKGYVSDSIIVCKPTLFGVVRGWIERMMWWN